MEISLLERGGLLPLIELQTPLPMIYRLESSCYPLLTYDFCVKFNVIGGTCIKRFLIHVHNTDRLGNLPNFDNFLFFKILRPPPISLIPPPPMQL